jgi:hypothetical protein
MGHLPPSWPCASSVSTSFNSGRIAALQQTTAFADIVAKAFWVSERATLIQDQAPVRNIDSNVRSS